MTLYADDPDVHQDFLITDSTGGTNDWSPTVTAGDETITAVWQGSPGATRTLRVPLYALGAGIHYLRLQVPSANDVDLGRVTLQ